MLNNSDLSHMELLIYLTDKWFVGILILYLKIICVLLLLNGVYLSAALWRSKGSNSLLSALLWVMSIELIEQAFICWAILQASPTLLVCRVGVTALEECPLSLSVCFTLRPFWNQQERSFPAPLFLFTPPPSCVPPSGRRKWSIFSFRWLSVYASFS